jgi:hypothetical protein
MRVYKLFFHASEMRGYKVTNASEMRGYKLTNASEMRGYDVYGILAR